MLRCALLSAVLVLGVGQAASAAVVQLFADMDGLQETPAVATPGFGTATLTVDPLTGDWSLTGSFSGLIGTTNNAHIHGPGDFGVPAGVLVPIEYTSGVTAGTISGDGTFNSTQLAYVLDELTYINIHTTFKSGGEIRGQLLLPEPASVMLLASGGLLLLRRRR